MEVFIGSDHAGFTIKEFVKTILNNKKIEFTDFGTHSHHSTDYTDYAHIVASKISKENGIGILICGTGNGICMTANKYQNVRAALCWNEEIAKYAKAHNDANILCLPGRYLSLIETEKIIDVFFNTKFEGGRHQLRINKINNE